jgi:hypothetical protein
MRYRGAFGGPDMAIPISLSEDDFVDLHEKIATSLRDAGLTGEELDQAIAATLARILPILQAEPDVARGDAAGH